MRLRRAGQGAYRPSQRLRGWPRGGCEVPNNRRCRTWAGSWGECVLRVASQNSCPDANPRRGAGCVGFQLNKSQNGMARGWSGGAALPQPGTGPFSAPASCRPGFPRPKHTRNSVSVVTSSTQHPAHWGGRVAKAEVPNATDPLSELARAARGSQYPQCSVELESGTALRLPA